jgi:CRP/FNR family cyclic AMP-dependent transcriptional regulator
MQPRAAGRSPSKRAPVFRPASLLAKITTGKSSRDYRQTQGIFAQGDAANAVFYLQRGKVELTVVSVHGKEAVIGTLGPGTFFGESCLAGQPRRMSTARALRSSTIVRVNKKTMVALLHREPEFSELFVAYLLSRNVRIEADLVDQLFNSSERRLARALLLLSRFGQAEKPEAVIPKLTQETLASMIGTTRAKIGYFMKRFRKLGFIDYEGGSLKVHNGLLTVVLHD